MLKKLLFPLLCLSSMAHADIVSWYGGGFHGRRAADGSVFNQNALTCASNSHALGTKLLVTNPKNNKSVIVKVTDKGGFGKYGRKLDLSRGAFMRIADLNQGVANVVITKL